MRSALYSLLSLIFVAACPPEGDATREKEQSANVLKNRVSSPYSISAITLADLLRPGDDTDRYSTDTGAEITGYIVDAREGGIESCNCHAKDSPHRDTHIYIALTPAAALSDCVIAEITPALRDIAATKGIEWTTASIKTLVGKKVKIFGWLFFDAEHKQNAVNTNPHGTNLWRATCYEIHPVLAISVAP